MFDMPALYILSSYFCLAHHAGINSRVPCCIFIFMLLHILWYWGTCCLSVIYFEFFKTKPSVPWFSSLIAKQFSAWNLKYTVVNSCSVLYMCMRFCSVNDISEFLHCAEWCEQNRIGPLLIFSFCLPSPQNKVQSIALVSKVRFGIYDNSPFMWEATPVIKALSTLFFLLPFSVNTHNLLYLFVLHKVIYSHWDENEQSFIHLLSSS